MLALETFPISSTVSIPKLGFGTFQIPDAETARAVSEALRIGYRHIDTAEVYQNEAGVGKGISEAIARGDITRDELFVTTKLWPGNSAWGDTPKNTETTLVAFDESLRRLGLDYVDLYLIHAPFEKEQWLAQWRAMLTLKDQGKARAVGVSNFNVSHLKSIVDAGLQKPDVNQIELHPWSQKPELVKYMQDEGIAPIAYSSLVPLSTWRTGHDSGKTEDMQLESENSDTIFKSLARKYGVSEAQLLLRWALQHGYAILPKSTNVDRMKQNADVFSFSIEDADMASMDGLDKGDGVAWSSGDPTKVG